MTAKEKQEREKAEKIEIENRCLIAHYNSICLDLKIKKLTPYEKLRLQEQKKDLIAQLKLHHLI